MKDFKTNLKDYAELIVRKGVNVQKGQPVRINCPLEQLEFGKMLTREAYAAGASEVIIDWEDDELTLLKYENAPMEVFEDFPKWKVDKSEYYHKKGVASISISATDPELFKDVDQKKVGAANKAASVANQPVMKYTMNDMNTWCVASVPTKGWASNIFPDLDEEEAVEKLWEEIFYATRADLEDPVKAWDEHIDMLESSAKYLNDKQFETLHYTNDLGTDLKVKLPENHIWASAVSTDDEDTVFIANIPTEEVYTMPHRQGVNGKLYSSKLFNYNGNLIDEMVFEFKDGKVVDYDAKVGKEHLDAMFAVDKRGKYLGEVAIVPHNSPISNQNILFKNTLYDENASCHFAFGKAYPTNLKGGTEMTDEELLEKGVNDSLIHEDFMVGTEDLKIVGKTHDGEEITIFEDGNWAI